MIDLFNEVKTMDSADEIKNVIKRALIEELAGEDFKITEIKKKSKDELVKHETYKRVKEVEKKENRKLNQKEKDDIKKEVEKTLK